MVLTAASVEWTVVGSDFEALQLEYTWIKEFEPPFNVKFQDDKSYPYLAVTLADEAPRVHGHPQPPHPRRALLRAVPEGLGGPRDDRPDAEGVPDPHLLRLELHAGDATGRPCFPGQIGRCGGPCSQKVTIEEHRAIVDQFVGVHGQPRPSDHRPARRRDAGRRPPRRTTSGRACCATSCRRSRTCSRRAPSCSARGSTPTSSASSTTSSRRRCSSSSCAAAASAVCAAGWSTRSSTSPLGELVESVLAERLRGRRSPPREIVVPALPDDAEALETWLGGLRRAAARCDLRTAQRGDKAALLRDGDAERQAGAHALQDPAQRRLRGAHRRRSTTSRRRSAWTMRRCASSATTSRT